MARNKVRPSNAKLEKLLSEKAYIESKVNECSVFIENAKSPLWQALKKQVESKLNYVMDCLREWRTITTDEKTGYLAQREILLEMSSFLSDSIGIRKQFEKMLLDKNTEIEQYKKKLNDL